MNNVLIERALTNADLEIRGDGRTVYGLAVPFDQEATVNDGYGNYREVFRRGAFRQTINVGVERVKFLVNHDRKHRLPIGKATSLREDAAGLVGEFWVAPTRDGDEVLELVKAGVLDAFSVGFSSVKERDSKGLIERLEVKLSEVSTVAFPAYAGAAISGVRSILPPVEELERLLEIARDLRSAPEAWDTNFVLDLDTRGLAAAVRTAIDEQSATDDEQAEGHSARPRTVSQRRALAEKTLERISHVTN